MLVVEKEEDMGIQKGNYTIYKHLPKRKVSARQADNGWHLLGIKFANLDVLNTQLTINKTPQNICN